MEGARLTVSLIIAILLQWTLRNIWDLFVFVDFPLIVVVYAALQRNSIRALIFGCVSGIAIDALSGGLLGATGFAKVLVAYIVSEIARRVYMDNLLVRIPVIAGACVASQLVYYGLHRLFSQTPAGDPLVTIAYSVIGTTIVGTLLYLAAQNLETNSGRGRKKREIFAPRRQTRRRNPIRLRK